jgi:N-acetylglutamate synthase-like GNAT family acetyltransferase
MSLGWERESGAKWDADKRRIVGGAPPGVFANLRDLPEGAVLPGDWWRVVDGGRVVAYAWMDVTWGDAEVLVAVEPTCQRSGVGTFAFDRLDREAADRGLRYLYNVVPATHPEPGKLTSWLERRGFLPAGEGALRRAVRRG